MLCLVGSWLGQKLMMQRPRYSSWHLLICKLYMSPISFSKGGNKLQKGSFLLQKPQ